MTKFLRSTIAASLLLVAGTAAEARPFDFDYNVTGDQLLSQAFDNGSRTFIQLKKQVAIDMAFGTDANGNRKPVAVLNTAPYLEIQGTYSKIELVAAGKTYGIQYAGNEQRVAATIEKANALGQQPVFAAVNTPALPEVQPEQPVQQRYQPRAALNAPVAVYGSAKPLFLGEEEHLQERVQDVADPLSIPFVAGKTTLGPKARAAVRSLANTARSNGQTLAIAVYSDAGGGKAQAVARGRSLRDEFAKYGIKNIDWRFGGEQAATNDLQMIKVAFLKRTPTETRTTAAASVVTPSQDAPVNFEKTLAQQQPAVTQQQPIVPTSPAAFTGDEATVQATLAAEQQKLDSSIKRLEDLKAQGILTVAEYQPAKDRLVTAFNTATAPLKAKLAAYQQARAQAETARVAEQERQRVQETVALNIKAKPIWLITESDTTLRTLLDKWAASAGWNLVWKLGGDFSISAKARLEGNLDQAVNQVLAAIQSSELPIVATFYEGNKTIKIDTKE